MRVTDERLAEMLDFVHDQRVRDIIADLQDARAEIARLNKVERAAIEYKLAHKLASDLTVTNHQETQRRSNACRHAWERLMTVLGGES